MTQDNAVGSVNTFNMTSTFSTLKVSIGYETKQPKHILFLEKASFFYLTFKNITKKLVRLSIDTSEAAFIPG